MAYLFPFPMYFLLYLGAILLHRHFPQCLNKISAAHPTIIFSTKFRNYTSTIVTGKVLIEPKEKLQFMRSQQ